MPFKNGNNNIMNIKKFKEKHKLKMNSKEVIDKIKNSQQKTYKKNLELYGTKNPKMIEARKKKHWGLKGKDNPMYGRTGKKHHLYGKKMSKQTREKISKTRIERIKSGDIKRPAKELNGMYGKKITNEHKKALWKGGKNKITTPERKLLKLYPNLKYTGDKKIWIKFKDGNMKNPDFISQREKFVIEVYGDYWHKNDDPNSLIKKYNDIGYNCLVLWEHEINDNSSIIPEIIERFINREDYEPYVHPQDDDYGICLNLLSNEIKEGLI